MCENCHDCKPIEPLTREQLLAQLYALNVLRLMAKEVNSLSYDVHRGRPWQYAEKLMREQLLGELKQRNKDAKS